MGIFIIFCTHMTFSVGVTTTKEIIEDLRAYARLIPNLDLHFHVLVSYKTNFFMFVCRTEQLKQEDILPVLRERLIQALTPQSAV